MQPVHLLGNYSAIQAAPVLVLNAEVWIWRCRDAFFPALAGRGSNLMAASGSFGIANTGYRRPRQKLDTQEATQEATKAARRADLKFKVAVHFKIRGMGDRRGLSAP